MVEVSIVDWDNVILRNIRFMRVGVWINPNSPFLQDVWPGEAVEYWYGLSSNMRGCTKSVKNVE